MKLYGYCYFNKKIGAYTAPQFLNIEPEVKKEADQRAFVMSKEEDKVLFGESDLYFLGVMDDKTAAIELKEKPEFICGFQVKENE